ncbi:LysR family transcriptional regulator [Dehalobacter sp. DCM]|uniref:LysR family transcriptional regulator n=1 Tax=Dehalobacter sp. DCM TaxID=2907827 RepID=UPI003081B5E8|nr:LysR family transcriptional regulator [Dehalobacter sp. DCM]
MEIKELEYFIAVCKYKSISKAANKLYISQQGLSRIINKLEEELQVLLFYRTSASLQLTEYGEFLLKRAQDFLLHHDNIKKDIKIFKERKEGELKIGFSYGVLNMIPQHLIENFVQKYPNVLLKINEYPDKVCEEEVYNEKIDIGFCVSPIDLNKFNVHASHKEQTAFMISEKNPLSEKTHLSFGEIRNERFIAFGKDTKGHDTFIQKCRKAGFEPNIHLSIIEMDLINKLCRNNVGIGFYVGPIPYNIPGIKIVKAFDEDWSWEICLVTKQNTYTNDIVRCYIDCFSKW